MKLKSSTPMAWKLILKPVFKAYILNDRVNKLLDYSEVINDQRISNQMYSKALKLQKKSNKLLGISQ
jgi:hypothetical protein